VPKLTIDDIDYNTEDLTENGRAQLGNLQFIEVQLQSLRNEIAVYQTAQNAYLTVLKAEIENAGIQPAASAEDSGE
jgi:hypothetical protein